MAYCLRHNDSSVEDAVRRIAENQIGKALEEAAADDSTERREAVHQVRKRCKRVRALLRLVRPVLPDYERENACLRDAAAVLSVARDAQVLVNTFERLLRDYRGGAAPEMLTPIRSWLSLRREAAEQPEAIDQALDNVCAMLREVAERARNWRLEADGFDAVEGGLAKTYGRAVKALAKARKDGSDDDFHEWRKRVKYHRFHTTLLSPIWPGPMGAHCEAADALGDCLGEHHDLAVLAATLSDEASPLRTLPAGDAARELVAECQGELAGKAFALGERVLAESPQALLCRWRRYWEVWQDDPQALEAAQ